MQVSKGCSDKRFQFTSVEGSDEPGIAGKDANCTKENRSSSLEMGLADHSFGGPNRQYV